MFARIGYFSVGVLAVCLMSCVSCSKGPLARNQFAGIDAKIEKDIQAKLVEALSALPPDNRITKYFGPFESLESFRCSRVTYDPMSPNSLEDDWLVFHATAKFENGIGQIKLEPRNPYPGQLGVIEEGAYADILLVNGNPLENLKLFNHPDENLALIMKDGKIYKNRIEPAQR